MKPFFEIAGIPVTAMMVGGLTACVVWIAMACIFAGMHRGTVWATGKKKQGRGGRILNSIGFGLLPAMTVFHLFTQTVPWGTGRVSASRWLSGTMLTTVNETGDTVYTVCRFEAMGVLILFALLVLWLALRRRPVPDNGDVLWVSVSLLGSLWMLSDSLHAEDFLNLYGVRGGQLIGLVLMLIPLIIWICRNAVNHMNTGYCIACAAVFVLSVAAIAVREYTGLIGNDRMTLSLIQLAGTLLAEKAVLCAGRVSRREDGIQ